MANNLYGVTGKPAAGSFGRSAVMRAEFDLIEAGFEKLKRHYVSFYFADLNTAGSVYLPALEVGEIKNVYVIPSANNGGAATAITLTRNGGGVTMPALEIPDDGLAGVAVSVAPTSTNVVTARTDILRAITDGGGNTVMPGWVIVEIERD